jgi:uncharacterized DUF497 family protein
LSHRNGSRIDPNDRKDRINRNKHGLNFDEAKEIFSRPGEVLTIPDRRKDYGEDRFINIGPIGDDLLVVVVHTNRAEHDPHHLGSQGQQERIKEVP